MKNFFEWVLENILRVGGLLLVAFIFLSGALFYGFLLIPLLILLFITLISVLFSADRDKYKNLKQEIKNFFNWEKISPTVKEIPNNSILSERIRRLLKDKVRRVRLFYELKWDSEVDVIEYGNSSFGDSGHYWEVDEEYKERLEEKLFERQASLGLADESEEIVAASKEDLIYDYEIALSSQSLWAEDIKRDLSEYKGEWINGQKVVKNENAITVEEIGVLLEMMCVEEMTDKTKLVVVEILED